MKPEDLINPCIPMPHGTQSKIFRDGKGCVLKDMRGGNPIIVKKEYEMQAAVYSCGHHVPKPFALIGNYILMEDLGETEKITDLDMCLEEAESLLDSLEEAGVRHNDLQPGNIIVKKNVPFAVDFGWSQWEQETPLDMPPDRDALLNAIEMMYKLGPEAKRSWTWFTT